MKHNKAHILLTVLILQLLQLLNNPLFHKIQNSKLTLCLHSRTTTTTALITQVSIRAASFLLAKTFF